MIAEKKIVGSCSLCGACCRSLIVPLVRYAPIVAEGGHLSTKAIWGPEDAGFYEARGCTLGDGGSILIPYDATVKQPWYLGYHKGKIALFVQTTCPNLAADGRCSIYEVRPESCRVWPVTAGDLELVRDVCSYRESKP